MLCPEKNMLVVGDECRYDFVGEFLSGSVKKELNLILKKNGDCAVELCETQNDVKDGIYLDDTSGFVRVYSGNIPHTVRMFVPKESGGEYLSDVFADGANFVYEKVIFVETYPYSTNDMLNLIREYIPKLSVDKGCVEFMMVLYRRKRNSGSTDIDTEEEALEKAADSLIRETDINKVGKVLTHVSGSSLEQLFRPCMVLESSLPFAYSEKLKKWRTEMLPDAALRFEFEIVDDILDKYVNFECVEKITSFKKIVDSDDIHGSYVKNFSGEYFKPVTKVILDFYEQTVSKICVWDIEKDRKFLFEKLKKMYLKKMESKEKYKAPETSATYELIISEHNIRSNFKLLLDEFFGDDVRSYLFDTYINVKIDCLIKLIGSE